MAIGETILAVSPPYSRLRYLIVRWDKDEERLLRKERMSNNPFDDNYQPSKYANGASKVKSYQVQNPAQDEADYYEKEIEKYMQESLDSTERSRAHLENSEKLGVNTAQELLAQREKLEKTERNLDEIHTTTQHTQRNLNSLKSMFGGFFKNKFSRKPPEKSSSSSSVPTSKSALGLSEATERVEAMPIRSGGMNGPTLSDSSRQAIAGTRWQAMDEQIDTNLDLMSGTLANLRSLGSALGTEIEDQNKMLDRIQTKAERNDAIVRNQDAQMKKILGYTPAESSKGK